MVVDGTARGRKRHANIDLAVLDLGGTTIRDDGHIAGALRQALAEHGVHVSAEQIAGLRGTSKHDAIARCLPKGDCHAAHTQQAFARFREHLRTALRRKPPQAIDGALATLHYLRGRGIRVALTTGLTRDLAQEILRSTGWGADVVDAVVCGDDVAAGRPAPYLIFKAMETTGTVDVRRVVNVGDSTHDLLSACNAGVGWNVGVLSGAHDRATLRRCPHTALIGSVAELPACLGGDV